jgi:hypothetical protein
MPILQDLFLISEEDETHGVVVMNNRV